MMKWSTNKAIVDNDSTSSGFHLMRMWCGKVFCAAWKPTRLWGHFKCYLQLATLFENTTNNSQFCCHYRTKSDLGFHCSYNHLTTNSQLNFGFPFFFGKINCQHNWRRHFTMPLCVIFYPIRFFAASSESISLSVNSLDWNSAMD